MRDVDLAYLAGMIDADGYITATMSTRSGTTYFGAQVGITGSRREPHDLAASLFGGNVTRHHPAGDRSHHRTQYHWQMGGRRAVPVIAAVQPHLRVKVAQAELAIHLQARADELSAARLSGDPAPWLLPGDRGDAGLRLLVEEIRAHHARRGQPATTHP